MNAQSTELEKILQTYGMQAALYRKKHRKYKPRKLAGDQEAHLVALCCGAPPERREEWTLRLLSERLIQPDRSFLVEN